MTLHFFGIAARFLKIVGANLGQDRDEKDLKWWVVGTKAPALERKFFKDLLKQAAQDPVWRLKKLFDRGLSHLLHPFNLYISCCTCSSLSNDVSVIESSSPHPLSAFLMHSPDMHMHNSNLFILGFAAVNLRSKIWTE
ncbi:hypothetical protein B0H14DRAFT_2583636 [Mycena olivaceomarginata]|nr:hypothetical protein B0H14DRAFT_2583636 [Mycena olivaceomarginata]